MVLIKQGRIHGRRCVRLWYLVCVRVYVRARLCVCACVLLSFVIAAPLTRFGRTMGRMTIKSTRRVLVHSLVCSLVHSCRTLIRFLRTACFARALHCAHSFAHLLPSSWERGFCLWNRYERVNFTHFQPTVERSNWRGKALWPLLRRQFPFSFYFSLPANSLFGCFLSSFYSPFLFLGREQIVKMSRKLPPNLSRKRTTAWRRDGNSI